MIGETMLSEEEVTNLTHSLHAEIKTLRQSLRYARKRADNADAVHAGIIEAQQKQIKELQAQLRQVEEVLAACEGACDAGRLRLVNELQEPGRTVFWRLVAARDKARATLAAQSYKGIHQAV